MTTDVSPSPTAGVGRPEPARPLTSPALLAAVGLYAAAAGHVIAALVHLSHGWSITAFFLVAAAVQVVVAGRIGRGTAGAGLVVAVLLRHARARPALRREPHDEPALRRRAHRAQRPPPGPRPARHRRRRSRSWSPSPPRPALLPEPLRRWSTTTMMLVGVGLWAAWATGLV